MKKRILLLATFIVAVLAVLCNVEKKEVKAEDNCKTYYNYYLFLDATPRNWMLNTLMKDKDSYEYETGKNFNLGIPEGATSIENGAINPGQSNKFPEWTLEYFYTTFKRIATGEVEYYTNNGTNDSYAMGYEWRDANGNSSTDSTPLPDTFEEFEKGVPSDLGNPSFNNNMITIGTTGIDSVTKFGDSKNSVKRTWTKSIIENSTSGETVWSPVVYYVSYELCEEVTPEKTYTLTVEHFLDETTEKLKEDYKKSGYKSGDTDSYNCPSIDGYTVVDNGSNKLSKHTFTFENEDIKKQCFYKEKTYMLTINFGDDETCKNKIAESVTYDGLKEGQVQTHKIEKSIGKLNNPKLGDFHEAFKTDPTLKDLTVSAAMPAKNVNICIVYSPQTGASWIYLVWVIGGLALGYSIWYFVRYYKKQNSEI